MAGTPPHKHTMDFSNFMASHGRLPTPQECIAQIKKLEEMSELAYQAYELESKNSTALQSITAEMHRLKYVYVQALMRAKNEGAPYSYVCVALEAEADEDMIKASLNCEPKERESIVAYYRPLVRQMIEWKAMKNLSHGIVSAR